MDAPDKEPARPVGAPMQPQVAGAVVFVVEGPIAPADIPGLCKRARALMDRGPVDMVICDVGALTGPDGATIDALARLQLAARRRGCRVALRGAGADLLGLLALSGLSDIVPLEG